MKKSFFFFAIMIAVLGIARAQVPSVYTRPVRNITGASAQCGGSVSSSSTVTARGVCWSPAANPTVDLATKTTNGLGTGSFYSDITGLTPGTTYHVRAYATNAAGTGYGPDRSFVTTGTATTTIPTLNTTTASAITGTTATSGGSISDDGGAAITARGICWSTSTNPTVTLTTKTNDGTGMGNFSSNIAGLAPGITYHVRSYATNAAGTAYGNDLSFTTPVLPTLTTDTISGITITTATSGGNINDDGGAAVTARGICWSTTVNPTVALTTKTNDGTGMGSFSGSITGLSPGTTYHVRAYATNASGTAYGPDLVFVTTNLVIGDSYQGGKVAYIYKSGDPGFVQGEIHGLIVTPSIIGAAQWSCAPTVISGARGKALGTGKQNTIDIVTTCPTIATAAKMCSDLELNGYSDWFLPSKDELNKAYINRDAIGNWINRTYWSSSTDNGYYGWWQWFPAGTQETTVTSDYGGIRAVRTF